MKRIIVTMAAAVLLSACGLGADGSAFGTNGSAESASSGGGDGHGGTSSGSGDNHGATGSGDGTTTGTTSGCALDTTEATCDADPLGCHWGSVSMHCEAGAPVTSGGDADAGSGSGEEPDAGTRK